MKNCNILSRIVIAMVWLTLMISAGAPMEAEGREHEEAFKTWLIKANAGDAYAMRVVGSSYYSGWGVDKDLYKARQWYEKAVNAGDAEACRHLGVMCQNGEGGPKNMYLAKSYYRQGVNRGYKAAQKEYNEITALEKRTSVSHTNSQASGRNNTQTKTNTQPGSNTPESNYKNLLSRAQDGDVNAMVDLGVCYYNGSGTKTNYYEAFRWFKEAADKKHPIGMLDVGLCYKEGHGVDKDYKLARYWYNKALNNKYEKAREYLNTLNDIEAEERRRRRSTSSSSTTSSSNTYTPPPTYNTNTPAYTPAPKQKEETRVISCSSCNGTGLEPRYVPGSVCIAFPEQCYDIHCNKCGKTHCHHVYHQNCTTCEGTGQIKQRKIGSNWVRDYR